MNVFSNLNAPVEYVDTIDGVGLWIKREDKIHPDVSGNKWRKLKYYLEDFKKSGKSSILTFGGAFSNHLAATAAIGRILGIPTRAIVRGEEVESNPTLDFCRRNKMEIEAISRKKYDIKDDPEFLEAMRINLPDVYIIPEGGKGAHGVMGCTEILDDVDKDFDHICCAAGTATTLTGLMASGYSSNFIGFPAVRANGFLEKAVNRQLFDFHQSFSTKETEQKVVNGDLTVEEKYHFGGYGKMKPELVQFMNRFYAEYGIPLDPVYTSKMMFGILEMIRESHFAKGDKILAIHSGGLQGIKGMNERLKKSGLKIEYEN